MPKLPGIFTAPIISVCSKLSDSRFLCWNAASRYWETLGPIQHSGLSKLCILRARVAAWVAAGCLMTDVGGWRERNSEDDTTTGSWTSGELHDVRDSVRWSFISACDRPGRRHRRRCQRQQTDDAVSFPGPLRCTTPRFSRRLIPRSSSHSARRYGPRRRSQRRARVRRRVRQRGWSVRGWPAHRSSDGGRRRRSGPLQAGLPPGGVGDRPRNSATADCRRPRDQSQRFELVSTSRCV